MNRAPGFLPKRRVSARRRGLLLFQKSLYWSGLAHLYAKLRRSNAAVILTYHSVADDRDAVWIDPTCHLPVDQFKRQVQFLAKHRNVISIGDVVRSIEEGRPLPRGAVVLTFDDGYRDFLYQVCPVLSELGVPAILYVPTGVISHARSSWADEIFNIFRTRRRHALNGADLRSVRRCRQVFQSLHERLIRADRVDRNRILANVREELDPAEREPHLFLTWEELRTIHRRFPQIDLGVHSCDHIDLTAHDGAVAIDDIDRSAAEFERELSWRPKHFAYPYNRSNDATREMMHGRFVTAVTAGPPHKVDAASDLLSLRRIDVPGTRTLFRFRTGGAYPDLSKVITGKA